LQVCDCVEFLPGLPQACTCTTEVCEKGAGKPPATHRPLAPALQCSSARPHTNDVKAERCRWSRDGCVCQCSIVVVPHKESKTPHSQRTTVSTLCLTTNVYGSPGSPPSLLCGKLPRFGRAHGRVEARGTDVEANKGAAPHVAPEGVRVVDRYAWIVKRGETSVFGGASEWLQGCTAEPKQPTLGLERRGPPCARAGVPRAVGG
jgi:hypothetical protein